MVVPAGQVQAQVPLPGSPPPAGDQVVSGVAGAATIRRATAGDVPQDPGADQGTRRIRAIARRGHRDRGRPACRPVRRASQPSSRMSPTADGEVVGFALWFLNFSTWLGQARHLPRGPLRDARRCAAAGSARRCSPSSPPSASRRGYGRLEWWVLDWNDPGDRLLPVDRRRADERVDRAAAGRALRLSRLAGVRRS